jgi:AhpD family alkylhydroperoxidase
MTDDVQVANRRLDASENEALIGMARMGADAFGYTADLRIDRALAQLLRLRVSQLNNCTYCLNLHYEAAREAGIPRAKIDTLTAWWETELHTEAEQAALRYAEALTRLASLDRRVRSPHGRALLEAQGPMPLERFGPSTHAVYLRSHTSHVGDRGPHAVETEGAKAGSLEPRYERSRRVQSVAKAQ